MADPSFPPGGAPRVPPRFVPTLTEVVRPGIGEPLREREALPSWADAGAPDATPAAALSPSVVSQPQALAGGDDGALPSLPLLSAAVEARIAHAVSTAVNEVLAREWPRIESQVRQATMQALRSALGTGADEPPPWT